MLGKPSVRIETERPKRVVGGYSKEEPPLPIPNRVVKLLCADGTAPKKWESRSLPTFFPKKARP